jgi:hypothetical protein
VLSIASGCHAPRPSDSARLPVRNPAVAPCLLVSLSPCLRVPASPRLRVSSFPVPRPSRGCLSRGARLILLREVGVLSIASGCHAPRPSDSARLPVRNPAVAPCLLVSLPPRLLVSLSPCLRVPASPRLRVSSFRVPRPPRGGSSRGARLILLREVGVLDPSTWSFHNTTPSPSQSRPRNLARRTRTPG